MCCGPTASRGRQRQYVRTWYLSSSLVTAGILVASMCPKNLNHGGQLRFETLDGVHEDAGVEVDPTAEQVSQERHGSLSLR
jgi:hypothetical protein